MRFLLAHVELMFELLSLCQRMQGREELLPTGWAVAAEFIGEVKLCRMLIYFVRHGSTADNDREVYQCAATPLSPVGVEQSWQLAQRLAGQNIELVLSSPMARALQTANAIAAATALGVVKDARFAEIRRPSIVIGRSKREPQIMSVMEQIDTHYEDENWQHSDEETFAQARQRAFEALQFLSSRSEKTVVVATHGEILRMILSVLVFGPRCSPADFDRIKKTFIPFNASMCVVRYDPLRGYNTSGWYVLGWNDHCHLLPTAH